MSQRLPPLNALRTFMYVARHLSFSRAAEELHVTPAAVTHQIRNLEAYLGVKLFHRSRRRVLLTEHAQACLPDLREGFDHLALGMQKLGRHKCRATVTVTVAPSFASKWLVPRLDQFNALHPEVDVRVAATAALADLHGGQADLAIRFGPGNYPEIEQTKLLPESLAPMCAPDLKQGRHTITDAMDLRHFRLIHDASMPSPYPWPDWHVWLDTAGVQGVDPGKGPRFSLAELALQAAIKGLGVVLGRTTLATDDLAEGLLVQPFDLSLRLDFAYFILLPEGAQPRPEVLVFRDWLLSQAGSEPRGAH